MRLHLWVAKVEVLGEMVVREWIIRGIEIRDHHDLQTLLHLMIEITGSLLRILMTISTGRIAAMASTKVQRIMTQPINLIFRIEGRIIGFDEYMNLVLDDAEEVNVKKKSRKSLGRILLKGDNITLMMNFGK
ncbi:hypothetical protein CMV_001641 [Castanea mollissima]|uniref:Small nuclear ribonucleoprotein E n=1 Tax=Castanea mollissima TaxID=60419 RepID=A0A8J4RUQ4_9ROSI|nr:hypothetical protein CMV_001641 [Castanea mollissima]